MKQEALKLADELEVPLVERLESVPKDARLIVREELSSSSFAIGSMCYEASAMIRRLVEELDKQGEPFGYLCDWGDDSYGLTRQTFYYGERGSPTLDDWNEYPKVHHNLPLYTTPQTKPLSDEEIHSMWDKLESAKSIKIKYWMFARRIEERHGIK